MSCSCHTNGNFFIGSQLGIVSMIQPGSFRVMQQINTYHWVTSLAPGTDYEIIAG